MNIILIPHNFTRHIAVAFYTGAVPLLLWWLIENWLVALGPWAFQNGLLWMPEAEGPIVFTLVAATIAATHISAEAGLRRRALLWTIALPFLAWLFTAIFTALFVVAAEIVTPMLIGLADPQYGKVYADPSTATLRARLAEWVLAGTVIGVVTLTIRVAWAYTGFLSTYIPESMKRFIEVPAHPPRVAVWMAIDHLLAGPGAAMVGAGVWHLFAHQLIRDMYLASALGFASWGFFYGLLAWGVPSDLYAGWVRVLSAHRYGHRIPVDAPDGGVVERILGHYPRGLDLWVGAEHGVAELHGSFVADGQGHYAVRGLSQVPLSVKRTLESVDLTYDPQSPVPLETDLRQEDRVLVGPKGNQTLVEFILLPKEER